MEAVAKHDFVASASDELSFSKNDILKVIDKEEDQNWYKAEKDGKEGLIPNNYIEMLPHSWFVGKWKRSDAEEKLLEKNSSNRYAQPDGAFLIRYSESTKGDFSLSVKFGEAVQHFKILRDDAGKYFLWVAKFKSINDLVNHHRTNSISRERTVYLKDMNEVSTTTYHQALYDFRSQDADEIDLKKNDKIVVIDNRDKDWWRGINKSTNKEGLFPASYVCLIGN